MFWWTLYYIVVSNFSPAMVYESLIKGHKIDIKGNAMNFLHDYNQIIYFYLISNAVPDG
jgi:hypothetical protein